MAPNCPGEDHIFLLAPPLESIRAILSIAATTLEGEPKHDRHITGVLLCRGRPKRTHLYGATVGTPM